jgi:RloB-like protein
MAKQIPLKLYIRCVCEGKTTEPNYIWGYLKSKGFKQPNLAYRAKDNSPIGVAQEAKKLYSEAIKAKIDKGNIFIWAVFDRDGHQGVGEAIEMLRETPINVAFSNICFEFWILLHYEYTTRSFLNCDEIIKYIRQQDNKSTFFQTIVYNLIQLLCEKR